MLNIAIVELHMPSILRKKNKLGSLINTIIIFFYSFVVFFKVEKMFEFKNDVLQAMFQLYQMDKDCKNGQMWFEKAQSLNLEFSEIHKNADFVNYVTKAAKYGHCDAHYFMFIISIRKPDNNKAALWHLHTACRNGKYLYELATVYHHGYHCCQRDSEKAKLLYKKAAELGNDEAEFSLEVARYTESYFGEPRQYRIGIQNAKKIASSNKCARDFIKSLKSSSAEAFYSDDDFEEADLQILREELDWEDELETESEDGE